MPRLTHAVPKYQKHKASGQAVVTIAGRDHYLGPYRTKASKLEYDRLIQEWLAAGRPPVPILSGQAITVTELINHYWKFAKSYYRKNGKPTGTANNLKPVLRLLRTTYGPTGVAEFRPVALESLQLRMIEIGHSRRYINDNIDRVRRMFRWGVSKELVPLEVSQKLDTVLNLAKGRSDAKETEPVKPVTESAVEATLQHLEPIVADMVRFQRLTGCRPSEVCMIRPTDVDIGEDIWAYRPESHKNEHHDRDRIIFIGPRAQDVLRPYLLRPSGSYCFSPAESERKRRERKHNERKTPISTGNAPGTNRKRRPRRSPGERYTKDSYRRAIHRACDATFPPPEPLRRAAKESQKTWLARLTSQQVEELKKWQARHRWSPNRIRHSTATDIRRRYGLEAAQVTLGHANANVTQVYAERDFAKAVAIMREVG